MAISVLCNPELVKTHGQFAHELLKYFNEMGANLYGSEFLVYNVHSFIHLKDSALMYGSLEVCSSWKYENYLHRLRKKIRIGRSPLVQIVKRLTECPILTASPADEELPVKVPNNVYYTNDKNFVSLQCKRQDGCYQAFQFNSIKPFFTKKPCCSLDTGVAVGHDDNVINRVVSKEEIKGKCLKLHIDQKKVNLSLLNHCL